MHRIRNSTLSQPRSVIAGCALWIWRDAMTEIWLTFLSLGSFEESIVSYLRAHLIVAPAAISWDKNIKILRKKTHRARLVALSPRDRCACAHLATVPFDLDRNFVIKFCTLANFVADWRTLFWPTMAEPMENFNVASASGTVAGVS